MEKTGENTHMNAKIHCIMYQRQKLVFNEQEKYIFSRKIDNLVCETEEQYETMCMVSDKRTKLLNKMTDIEHKLKKYDRVENICFPSIESVDNIE